MWIELHIWRFRFGVLFGRLSPLSYYTTTWYRGFHKGPLRIGRIVPDGVD